MASGCYLNPGTDDQAHHEIQRLPSFRQPQSNFEQTLRPLLPKVESDRQPNSSPSPYQAPRKNEAICPRKANATCAQILPNSQQHPADSHLTLSLRNNCIHYDNFLSSSSSMILLDRWQLAREYHRKVQQPPFINPQTDLTISNVEQHAEFWVSQLALAMINISNVKDRDNSHAKKMFSPNCYDALLIESTSREIFLALLDRCKHGFREPTQFDKSLKPVRDVDCDKDAVCIERLRNIIQALKWNKRVCKDVLYEDWKIILLVNHPLAYDKEKDSQKDSDDQRRARQIEERERLRKSEEELDELKRSCKENQNIHFENDTSTVSSIDQQFTYDLDAQVGLSTDISGRRLHKREPGVLGRGLLQEISGSTINVQDLDGDTSLPDPGSWTNNGHRKRAGQDDTNNGGNGAKRFKLAECRYA